MSLPSKQDDRYYDPEWRKRAGVNKNAGKMGKVENDDRADWREAWALFPGYVAYVWHAGIRAGEVAINLHQTLAGRYGVAARSRPGWLALVASLAYLTAMALGILVALPSVSRVTEFTLVNAGVSRLFLLGFFAAVVFAVWYDNASDLLTGFVPSGVLAKVQVGCWLLGVGIQVTASLGFGVAHGRALSHHDLVFLDALKPGQMALRMGTVGSDLLVFIGSGALVLN